MPHLNIPGTMHDCLINDNRKGSKYTVCPTYI